MLLLIVKLILLSSSVISEAEEKTHSIKHKLDEKIFHRIASKWLKHGSHIDTGHHNYNHYLEPDHIILHQIPSIKKQHFIHLTPSIQTHHQADHVFIHLKHPSSEHQNINQEPEHYNDKDSTTKKAHLTQLLMDYHSPPKNKAYLSHVLVDSSPHHKIHNVEHNSGYPRRDVSVNYEHRIPGLHYNYYHEPTLYHFKKHPEQRRWNFQKKVVHPERHINLQLGLPSAHIQLQIGSHTTDNIKQTTPKYHPEHLEAKKSTTENPFLRKNTTAPFSQLTGTHQHFLSTNRQNVTQYQVIEESGEKILSVHSQGKNPAESEKNHDVTPQSSFLDIQQDRYGKVTLQPPYLNLDTKHDNIIVSQSPANLTDSKRGNVIDFIISNTRNKPEQLEESNVGSAPLPLTTNQKPEITQQNKKMDDAKLEEHVTQISKADNSERSELSSVTPNSQDKERIQALANQDLVTTDIVENSPEIPETSSEENRIKKDNLKLATATTQSQNHGVTKKSQITLNYEEEATMENQNQIKLNTETNDYEKGNTEIPRTFNQQSQEKFESFEPQSTEKSTHTIPNESRGSLFEGTVTPLIFDSAPLINQEQSGRQIGSMDFEKISRPVENTDTLLFIPIYETEVTPTFEATSSENSDSLPSYVRDNVSLGAFQEQNALKATDFPSPATESVNIEDVTGSTYYKLIQEHRKIDSLELEATTTQIPELAENINSETVSKDKMLTATTSDIDKLRLMTSIIQKTTPDSNGAHIKESGRKFDNVKIEGQDNQSRFPILEDVTMYTPIFQESVTDPKTLGSDPASEGNTDAWGTMVNEINNDGVTEELGTVNTPLLPGNDGRSYFGDLTNTVPTEINIAEDRTELAVVIPPSFQAPPEKTFLDESLNSTTLRTPSETLLPPREGRLIVQPENQPNLTSRLSFQDAVSQMQKDHPLSEKPVVFSTTTHSDHPKRRSDILVDEEEENSVEALSPLIPVIVYNLQVGTVSEKDLQVLKKVFGEQWPRIEELAEKKLDAQLESHELDGDESSHLYQRDVHYTDVLDEYIEKGHQESEYSDEEGEWENMGEVSELMAVAKKHKDWRTHKIPDSDRHMR